MSTLDRNADDPVRIRRNWQKLSKLVGDATDVDAGGRMRFMGVWDSATQYEPNDVVLRTKTFGAEDEAVFVSLTTNTNSALPTDSTDSDDWSHLTYSLTDSDNTSVVVSLAHGGTGLNAYSRGDLIYAPATDQLTTLAFTNAASRYLTNQGAGSTVPAWSQVNLANGVFGTLAITFGGTGATTANAAFNNLVPSQTSNSGKALTTDGTDTHWTAVGSVTSVALALPASILTVSGSPVTTSGTLTGSLATQTANFVWAGPTSGSAATPTFRALVLADIPSGGGSPLTTKGDLYTFSTVAARLGVGTNGYSLTPDSSQTTGLLWTSLLFHDTANSRVGIGQTTPTGTLHVKNVGTSVPGFQYETSGATVAVKISQDGKLVMGSVGSPDGSANANVLQVYSNGSNGVFTRISSNSAATSSSFRFQRSRGNQNTTITTTASGDRTFFISSEGYDGTSFIDAATMSAEVDGAVSSNIVPMRFIFKTGTTSGGGTEALRIDSAQNTKIAGSLYLNTAGSGLLVKEGSNATMGVATLVAGTVTVSTTKVTANSRIHITVSTAGGTQGFLSYTISAGVSFTVTSTNAADTSTFNWLIVEPA